MLFYDYYGDIENVNTKCALKRRSMINANIITGRIDIFS